MADILRNIIEVAVQIKEIADTVKANKNQCKILSGYVDIITELVQHPSQTSLSEDNMKTITSCFVNCKSFIDKFRHEAWYIRIIKKGSHKEKFVQLKDHLHTCVTLFNTAQLTTLNDKLGMLDIKKAEIEDDINLSKKETQEHVVMAIQNAQKALLDEYRKRTKIVIADIENNTQKLMEEHKKEHEEHQDILDKQYAMSLQLMSAIKEPMIIKDGKKGEPEIRKSAKSGNAYAQCQLGDLYSKEHDHTKAHKWYLRSANQGYAWAQYNLGEFYKNGTGVVKSYEIAQVWYMLVAKQTRNISAQCCALCTLGDLYRNGHFGNSFNLEKAREFYEKAAAQKHPWSMCHLANFSHKGIGGLLDINKARELYMEVIACESSYGSKTAKEYAKKELENISMIGNPPLLWHALCDFEHQPFIGSNVMLTEAGKELVEHSRQSHNGLKVGRITPLI